MTDDENWDAIANRPEFEWNENKRLSNADKHGLDFVDCRMYFSIPALSSISRTVEAEKRYVIVGRVKERTVSVVFTRRGSLIRTDFG